MKARMSVNKEEPRIYPIMMEANKLLTAFEIDRKTQELIRIRASQINGCGYCINHHTKDALKVGETAQRIFALSAWWETPFFSEEEQIILKLTEEMTMISEHGVSEDVFQNGLRLLGEKKMAQLIFIVCTINSWNRIAIATRMVAEVD
jgi:AhpD family alkylhydroperoxidase